MSVYSLFVLVSLLGKPFGYSHFDTRSRLDRHLAGVGSTEDLIRLYYPQQWRKIMCHMRGGGERYLSDYQSDYSEDGSGMGRSAAAATMDLMDIVNKDSSEPYFEVVGFWTTHRSLIDVWVCAGHREVSEQPSCEAFARQLWGLFSFDEVGGMAQTGNGRQNRIKVKTRLHSVWARRPVRPLSRALLPEDGL
uniref:Uncharacterized protein n=1 Tax=Branchiostoma floridae TaxID=7739 RepID=C3XWJ3_BRAFL|eukprot:XP_002611717.1 hypothetical protein BRAFLDRAFT_63592 [Branchiostoma floridae]